MIDEAGEGDVRRCFTLQDVSQACYHPEEILTLPFAWASSLRVSGRVALSMPGGTQPPDD